MKTLIQICRSIVIVFCLLTAVVNAQWVQTNGPYGGYVQAIAMAPSGAGDTNIFLGTNGGVFLSTNNGTNWSAVNSGLNDLALYVPALVSDGSNIFAGTYAGVFRSTNNGTSWTDANTGLTIPFINTFAVSGTNLFAGTYGGGVYLSTNNGSSWSAVNTGLTSNNVMSLLASGTNLFAGTDGGGVFLSTNNGSTWTDVNSGFATNRVYRLAMSGSNLFAGTLDDGVYLSADSGMSWNAVNTGLTGKTIWSLAVSSSNIFAATNFGVFKSTNNGTSWSEANTGLEDTRILSFAVSGSNVFTGTHTGVYLSTDNGANWAAVNTGLTNLTIHSLFKSGANLLAGAEGKIFLSTNNGSSWARTGAEWYMSGFTPLCFTESPDGTNLFMGGSSMALSTDNGTSWTLINNGITGTEINSLAISGTNLFAGTDPQGVFLSPDNGGSWSTVNTGLPSLPIRRIAASGSTLIAGLGNGGIYLSTNSGTNWAPANNSESIDVNSLIVSGTSIFAGSHLGVHRSTDEGADWVSVSNGITLGGDFISSFAVSGTYMFAGAARAGIYLSSDSGAHWTPVNNGLTGAGREIYSLMVSGASIFAGTTSGIYVAQVESIVPPGVPQSLAVTDSSYLTFTLKWRKNSEADFLQYRIYYGTSTNPTTASISTAAGINDTSIVITGLSVGTKYYFRVTAVDSLLNESGYSNEVSAIPFNIVTASYNTKTISFGKVVINQFKDTTVTITNTGNDTLKIAEIISQWNVFTVRPVAKDIPPGQSFSDTIRFTPETMGEYAAMILVQSNAFSGTDTLLVSGYCVNYDASVNWTTASFGEVPVGQSKDTTIVVTNIGNDTLRVTSIVSSNPAFSSRISAFDLAPNKWLEDTVRFEPSKLGVDSAAVVITSNSPTSPDTILVFGTGVTPTSVTRFKGIPTVYSLAQNYPNPFNPSTTITFGLPSQSFVTLKVFDLIGREVATLVSEELTAGFHSRNWNAAGLSGGVYFYRLRAGNFVETKKLILLK